MMGVSQLWQILAPVQQHRPLSSLGGQTLAVDLSIWVCETQCVKQMQGVVSKPFLRNLFFRISHLTQLGVKLVFVVEGTAPELKWEAMMKRQQVRFPGRQGRQPQHRQGRRNFNSCLRECCQMLDILGIPYVQSHGEAEAMCAALNAAGLVDGCLTNDGDAFLYGATVVYRNFTMNTKDPHVESYRLSDIQEKIGIDRDGLVSLALLLGCDYIPKGVPGIGYANAVKLLQTLKGRNLLRRLHEWRSISETDCLDQVEVLMRKKAMAVPDFPQEKVIQEFLISKDKCPRILPSWKRPIINQLQDFALDKLEWPVEYSLEKILPLVTLWDMRDIIQCRHPSTSLHLKPHRIVKTRVRQGVPCYEVEWHKPVSDTTCPDDYYTTIEEQDMFSQCHQQMVDDFTASVEEKKSKKGSKGSRKKKKEEQKQINTESKDNIKKDILAPPSLGHTADELSESFTTLKIGDSKKEAKETVPGNLGNDSVITSNATMKCRAKTAVNNKMPKSQSLPEFKLLYSDVLPPESDVHNNDSDISEEVLDTSNNDSFIPLSLRVKKILQEKKAIGKYGSVDVMENCDIAEKDTALKRNNHDVYVIDDKCNSNETDTETKIMNISLPHPTANDSFGFSTSHVNDLAVDKSNFPETLIERNGENYCKTLGSPFGGTPRPASSIETEINTPLSLQKEFMNERYNTKVSSPSGVEFCSPTTYIKETIHDNKETDGLMKADHALAYKRPEVLVTDCSLNGNVSATRIVNNSSFCEVITHKDISDAKEITPDVVDNPCGNFKFDEVGSNEDQHLEVKKNLVTTPLYSVSRFQDNNLKAVCASPLHMIFKHKLETSNISLLDNPNFDIQTSLLNSLCKTLDLTSSPFKSINVQETIFTDTGDTSFNNIGRNSIIKMSESPGLSFKTIRKETEMNSAHGRISSYHSNTKDYTSDINILTTEADQFSSRRPCDDLFDIVRLRKTLVMDHADSLDCHYVVPENSESSPRSGLPEKVNTDNMEITALNSNAEISQKYTKMRSQKEMDTLNKQVTTNTTNNENLQASMKNIKPEREIVSASQKARKVKTKVSKKGKKKGVKKVSATMDLSHDSDNDIILSQMISSQEDTACRGHRKSTNKEIKEPCISYETVNKENNHFIAQFGRKDAQQKLSSVKEECKTHKELLTDSESLSEILGDGCPSVVKINFNGSGTKSNTESDINAAAKALSIKSLNMEPGIMVKATELNVFKQKKVSLLGEIDLNAERTVQVMENKVSLNKTGFLMKDTESLKNSNNMSVSMETTFAAASPVSLADRLKKRLKNSSTRQVLTDFTKF